MSETFKIVERRFQVLLQILKVYVKICLLGCFLAFQLAYSQTVTSSLTLQATGSNDQDDMCFWLHPSDLSQSTIICSDKSANRIFVYDLEGNTIQEFSSQKPGGIDIRYGFLLGGNRVDIVAFNEREGLKIRVYKVNSTTRQLEQVDDGSINTGRNYGFTLYRSPITNRLYTFTGPKDDTIVKQYELSDNGSGQITGTTTGWEFSPGATIEGMVADDETGYLYLGEEEHGIWKVAAEPDSNTHKAVMIAQVGENGLEADIEGVTIYYAADGEGYIIASSQGNDSFKLYLRKAPHNFIGAFQVRGVSGTDGIDVINVPLDANFSQGIFTCHNDEKIPKAVEVIKWEHIVNAMGGLIIDTTYWDPRKAGTSLETRETSGKHVPSEYILSQNYPNPFNPSTNIFYSIPRVEHISLVIYDISGERVSTLVDGIQSAGNYTVVWEAVDSEGSQLPSGIYLCRMQTGSYTNTLKMLLIQ